MSNSFKGCWLVVLLTAGVAAAQPVKSFKWEANLSIPDNAASGVSDTQMVPDDGSGVYEIRDVDVDLFIEHTWQGDLIVNISHAGVTVPLLYRAGDSTNGAGFGFSADNFGNANTKFILNDDAAAFYDSAPPNGIGNVADPGFVDGIDPTSGNNMWRPFGVNGPSALAAFNGLDKRGPWTLFVSDNAVGDTGRLVNWSLHVQNVPEPTPFAVLAMCGLALLGRRSR